jgi:hypothetical protein
MASARRRVSAAMAARLAPGERVLAGGFAWVAVPRPHVPLLVLQRRPHLLGLTDRRVMLWHRPRRNRPVDDTHVVFAADYDELSLVAIHPRRPMFQIRLRTEDERELVVELRPRERQLARRLVAALDRPDTLVPEPAAAP